MTGRSIDKFLNRTSYTNPGKKGEGTRKKGNRLIIEDVGGEEEVEGGGKEEEEEGEVEDYLPHLCWPLRETENEFECIAIPEEDGEKNPNTSNASILGILGYEQIPQKKTSPKIHPTIVDHWGDILRSGLPQNKVMEMVKKYPPVENCPWIEVPKLNPEVNVVINELARKRDQRVQKSQNQIGAAITAIAQALNEAVEEESPNIRLIERLSDAGRILTAVNFEESSLRRGLINPGINDKLKDELNSTAVDGYLYGNNLGEKIKETKALEKVSETFKFLRNPQSR
ncbi:uncharacterized protein LOC123306325 [Coccinella septempunctata]|uniref:uncharacterized protein LOC123306325 n=1 Tax=Coccinella septempunctata TaxID=41139 RepID=UPI001D061C4B|nr:uncharacterized protein LOC123306325 [Coccinella septempunctata]